MGVLIRNMNLRNQHGFLFFLISNLKTFLACSEIYLFSAVFFTPAFLNFDRHVQTISAQSEKEAKKLVQSRAFCDPAKSANLLPAQRR